MSHRSIRRRDVLRSAAVSMVAVPALVSGCATAAARTATKADTGGALEYDYFDGPDGQVHYWTAGSGPNLVLVHQSNNSNEEYIRLAPYLAEHYRMIVMDLPGHGNSHDPKGPHDVDKLTDAVIALADHLSLDQFHISGHHGGALVAMNVVKKQPSRVMKTILSGSSGPKTEEEAEAFRNAIKSRVAPLDWEGKSIADTWDRYVSLKSDDSQIEDLLSSYLTTTKTRIRPYSVYDAFLSWDRSPALDALKGPVLLIQGDKDNFVSHQDRLLSLLPDSRRVVLPGCGVFMYYERAQDCAAAIHEFLG